MTSQRIGPRKSVRRLRCRRTWKNQDLFETVRENLVIDVIKGMADPWEKKTIEIPHLSQSLAIKPLFDEDLPVPTN